MSVVFFYFHVVLSTEVGQQSARGKGVHNDGCVSTPRTQRSTLLADKIIINITECDKVSTDIVRPTLSVAKMTSDTVGRRCRAVRSGP